MNREAERQLRQLAAGQHGVVNREQARCSGLSRDEIQGMVRSGRWSPVGRTGLALEGAPDTELHRCSSLLRATATSIALSHETAAAFWGVRRFRLLPVHLLARRGANLRVPDGVEAHHVRRVLPHHVVEVDELRVTTPARTVFDLSGTLHPRWRVEDLLDDAWAMRLVNYRSMADLVRELSGRGQRNVAELRELVERRGKDYLAPQSNLERRFHAILAEAGLPPMDPQVDIHTDEGWSGRVDAVYPDVKVIVEIDGDRWHTTIRQRAFDRDRQSGWEAAGYLVVRFDEHDVWHRRAHVVQTLRRARWERRHMRSSA